MIDVLEPFVANGLEIDGEEADRVFSALASGSAREILAALDDGPATVAELADETAMTRQNVSYHLEKLADADLVRANGTRGTGATEATVYEPAKDVVMSTGVDIQPGIRVGIVGLLVTVLLWMTCLPPLL